MWVKSLSTFILAALVVLVPLSFADGSADVGKRAPKITAFTLDGELISLENMLRRDAVLLYFWRIGCPRCMEDLPVLLELHDNYKRKLRIVGINPGVGENISDVRDFEDEYGIRHDLVFDKERKILQDYEVAEIPLYVIVNKRGRITYRGDAPLSEAEIEDRRAELLE